MLRRFGTVLICLRLRSGTSSRLRRSSARSGSASRVEVLWRFAWCVLPTSSGCAGIPPRRAGHFHLTRQMKVTKAKALSTRHSCVATGRDLSTPCWLVAQNICCDFFPTRLAAHRLGDLCGVESGFDTSARTVGGMQRSTNTLHPFRLRYRSLARTHASCPADAKRGESGVRLPLRTSSARQPSLCEGRVGRGRFFAYFLVDTRKEVARRAETPARPHAVNKTPNANSATRLRSAKRTLP